MIVARTIMASDSVMQKIHHGWSQLQDRRVGLQKQCDELEAKASMLRKERERLRRRLQDELCNKNQELSTAQVTLDKLTAEKRSLDKQANRAQQALDALAVQLAVESTVAAAGSHRTTPESAASSAATRPRGEQAQPRSHWVCLFCGAEVCIASFVHVIAYSATEPRGLRLVPPLQSTTLTPVWTSS